MSFPRERMTDCSEKPDSLSGSLLFVRGERRYSNIASGPPYGYLIFHLGPICRTCGSLAVFTARSISNTSDSRESVGSILGHHILGQDFSQKPSQCYVHSIVSNYHKENLKVQCVRGRGGFIGRIWQEYNI